MNSLIEHDTWSLTKLPPGRKIVGSKWVFKIKHDENGEAARYKCRLVAQGYTQAQGIDYHETFAPVARFGSIRTLLATAAQREMYVHQMDVHTAFLNRKLDEDIYMCQPEGFVVKGKEDMVCHLHRSLYGLKPRCWNKELSCHLFQSGFQQSKADPCVFFHWKDGHLNIVSIYVDDLILVVDLMKDLLKTKEELSSQFKMKDLGQLRYCLGIVCEQEDGRIRINQKAIHRQSGEKIRSVRSIWSFNSGRRLCETGGRRRGELTSRSEAVSADCWKYAVCSRWYQTRHCLRGKHNCKVLPSTDGAAHDSSQACTEVSETDKRPQLDIRQEHS